MSEKKKSHRKIAWKEWIRALGWAILIVVVLKSMVGDFFIVPSESMEGSILKGDFVYVNKLKYGPRIPNTPLSFPFSRQTLPLTNDVASYSTIIQLPYMRIWGYADVKHNDIIVFNYPVEKQHPTDQRSYFVKRCIGLPGDTLNIINKRIFINGKEMEDAPNVLKKYSIRTRTELSDSTLKAYGIAPHNIAILHGEYVGLFTKSQIDSLSYNPLVKSIRSIGHQLNEAQNGLFPNSDFFNWNTDFYGPVYIPKAGDSIRLTAQNILLYLDLIADVEDHFVDIVDDKIYIDNKETEWYTFEMDYFFAMGDNRDFSSDSRFWGFVPESHLIGTASFVLYSADKEAGSFLNIRWNRFFEGID